MLFGPFFRDVAGGHAFDSTFSTCCTDVDVAQCNRGPDHSQYAMEQIRLLDDIPAGHYLRQSPTHQRCQHDDAGDTNDNTESRKNPEPYFLTAIHAPGRWVRFTKQSATLSEPFKIGHGREVVPDPHDDHQ